MTSRNTYTVLFFVGSLTLISDGNSTPKDSFTGFFPCVPDSVNMSTQEDAQSCDLFVYAAVQLALDRVEEELESERPGLSSIVTERERGAVKYSDVNQVLYNLYIEISHNGQALPESLSLIRGVIGTDDNYAHGVPSASFSERLQIPIVSYGLSDSRFDNYSVFHRTIPSTVVLNTARLILISQFEWYRIGILGSSQKEFNYQMESFREFFNRYVEKQIKAELSYEGTTNELHYSLLELHKLDIRIILGFFGPEEMRVVLCEASSEQYNLTTPDHVWILPSYYNPDWWKGSGVSYYSNLQTLNCSDEQMVDILNSVIFLDPVKYPPLSISQTEFYPLLINKTRKLFSQLSSEVNLESLLQHSRAVSAYDSTLLLARSLTDGRVDRDKLHSKIVCELCRIYSEQTLELNVELQFCYSLYPLCRSLPGSDDSIRQLTQYVSRKITLNSYGQVLITQFINGTHCPMVLFWPALFNNSTGSFIDMVNLSNFSGQLELDPRAVFPNSAVCQQQFYWKGRDSPPSSNVLLTSNIPEWALVFVGVVTGLSEMVIIFFIVFSIIWRKNIHVKSTSPRVNVVMLFGAAVHIPYPLFIGVILSGTRYNIDTMHGTVLCQFSLWIRWVGITLIVTGLATKVFRLYRIFRNTSLRVKLRHLSDRNLIISAVVLVIPVLIVLLVWTAIPDTRYKYHVDYIENGKIQYVQVTSCHSVSSIENIFDALIQIYVAIIFLMSLGMSLFIVGAPRSIRIDLSMTRAAVGVGALTVIFESLANVIGRNRLFYETVWGFQVLDAVFGSTIVMILLVTYQVVLVAKDYKKKAKEKYCKKRHKSDSNSKSSVDEETHFQSLLCQITELSNSLAEKETAISQLKMQEQFSDTMSRKQVKFIM